MKPERRIPPNHEIGAGDQRKAEPADGRRKARALRPTVEQRHRGKAAEREFPGPQRREIERPGLRDLGQPRAQRERNRGHRRHRQQEAILAGPQPGKQQQQRRPGQVELLLDRQRPERDERVAGRIRREIIERPADQPDIDHVGRGKQRPFGIKLLLGRREDEIAGGERDQDDEQRRGQQAAGAPRVERPQIDRAALGDLLLRCRVIR